MADNLVSVDDSAVVKGACSETAAENKCAALISLAAAREIRALSVVYLIWSSEKTVAKGVCCKDLSGGSQGDPSSVGCVQ